MLAMHINFRPFPILQSNRLTLRKITEHDALAVFSLRSNPEAMKYIPRPLALTLQDAVDHIHLLDKELENNAAINWGITKKGDTQMIGMICLLRMQPENFRTEVGYILHPAFHQQGVMSEAIGLVLDYAFNQLQFHAVEAVIDPNNLASEKLLVKTGFRKEAHFKEHFFYEGRFLDTAIYTLLKSQFLQNKTHREENESNPR